MQEPYTYTDTPVLHSWDSPKKMQTSRQKIRSTAQHHPEDCCDMAIFHREWTHKCLYENLPLADSYPWRKEHRSSGWRSLSSPDPGPNSPKTSISTMERFCPACLFRARPGICPFGQPFFVGFGALWRAALAAQQSATSRTNPWILWPRTLSASGPQSLTRARWSIDSSCNCWFVFTCNFRKIAKSLSTSQFWKVRQQAACTHRQARGKVSECWRSKGAQKSCLHRGTYLWKQNISPEGAMLPKLLVFKC